jgi:hypothetical protein
MKITNKVAQWLALQAIVLLMAIQGTFAQMPMPPHVPIWDANLVTLKLHKITDKVLCSNP